MGERGLRFLCLAMLILLMSSSSTLAAGPIFTSQGGISAPGPRPAYSIDAQGNAVLNSLSGLTMVGQIPISTLAAEANGALPSDGGNASQTVLIATGSVTSRSQADRAADIVNVMDFGARGDDVHDDTASINMALSFVRTKNIGTNGPFVGTDGPYAHLVFPSGHRFRISAPLNFTGFPGSGIDVDAFGSSIDCHATGQVCIDALGSNELRFHNFRVIGDPTDMPRIGMQIGRTDTYATADNHIFDGLAVIGQFSFTAFYNFAAETTTFIHPEFWNFSGIPGSFALVMDDYNHFGITSSFHTISARADTPSSFNENLFIGADVRSGVGQTVPMWLGGTARLSFIRSYAAGGGTSCSPTCFGAVIYNAKAVYNTMLHIDVHFETSGLTDVFELAGDPSQAMYGFDYLDQGPQASNSILKLAANMTFVELRDADIQIAGYAMSGAKFLDDPGKWRISGRYSSQSATEFNATAAFQGQLNIGSSYYSANYGGGSLQTQVADGTIVGGNTRGPNAVDWQSSRSLALQVASGNFSTIGGGQNNAASGPYSTIVGGVQNTVTSQFGSAMGYGNTVSGMAAVGLGIGNTASGMASLSAGSGAGDNGNDGTLAWATGTFSNAGDATATLHVLRGSGAGAFRLTVDAGPAASATCLGLPANTSFGLSITLEARDSSTGANDYLWKLPTALLARDVTLASTVFVPGSSTTLSRGNVNGASVSATADTSNGCLNLSFTPPSANSGDIWHAVARIDSVDVR